MPMSCPSGIPEECTADVRDLEIGEPALALSPRTLEIVCIQFCCLPVTNRVVHVRIKEGVFVCIPRANQNAGMDSPSILSNI